MFTSRTSIAAVVASGALAVGAAIAVAAPTLAPTTAPPAAEHDHSTHSHADAVPDSSLVTGVASSAKLQVIDQTVSRSGRATGDRLGVLSYRSQSGGTCFVAGPVEDGSVGRVDAKGAFTAVDPADAPGTCGEFDQNLAEFGGVALASSSASVTDPTQAQAVIYGLTAQTDTTVSVKLADGTELRGDVQAATGLGGAPAIFSIPLPLGASPEGASATLTGADGKVLHTFGF